MRAFRNNLLGLPPTRPDVQYQPTCQTDTLTDYEIDNDREEFPSNKVLELVAYTVYKRRLLYVCLVSTLIFAGIVAMRLTVNIEPDVDDYDDDEKASSVEKLTDLVTQPSINSTVANDSIPNLIGRDNDKTNSTSESSTALSSSIKTLGASDNRTPSTTISVNRETTPVYEHLYVNTSENSRRKIYKTNNSEEQSIILYGTRHSGGVNNTLKALATSSLKRNKKFGKSRMNVETPVNTDDSKLENVHRNSSELINSDLAQNVSLTNSSNVTSFTGQIESRKITVQNSTIFRPLKKRKKIQNENEISDDRS